MDLLDKGWFIIFLVIAFIGGNLAALRVTANMKFPRGRAPTQRDADEPVEPHTDDSANASDGNTPDTLPDTPPDAPKAAPSAPPIPHGGKCATTDAEHRTKCNRNATGKGSQETRSQS